MMQMIQSHKISCFSGMCTSLFLFRPTSFGNLKALSGRLHKFVAEAGDIIVVPARWPHVVATKGDSIAFASNFLAVTHFPLIVNSHLNASQQDVFPAIIPIYAVLQCKIQQLQRELKKATQKRRGRRGRRRSKKNINRDLFNPFFRDPFFRDIVTLPHILSDEQLKEWKELVRRETQEIKSVRNFC